MRFIPTLLLALALCMPVRAIEPEEPAVEDTKFKVSFFVPQQIYSAPAQVLVIVTVERHPDHRKLVIAWESSRGEGRSSDFQLDGDKAKRKFQYWAKGVKAGKVTFTATVIDNMDKKTVIKSPIIRVTGIEDMQDDTDGDMFQ